MAQEMFVKEGKESVSLPPPVSCVVEGLGRCRGAIMADNTITVDNKTSFRNVALAFQLVWNV